MLTHSLHSPEFSISLQVACIEGLCGGAMLTMIANTVLPEAFERGGDIVGLSCLMGFMSALLVKALGEHIEQSGGI